MQYVVAVIMRVIKSITVDDAVNVMQVSNLHIMEHAACLRCRHVQLPTQAGISSCHLLQQSVRFILRTAKVCQA